MTETLTNHGLTHDAADSTVSVLQSMSLPHRFERPLTMTQSSRRSSRAAEVLGTSATRKLLPKPLVQFAVITSPILVAMFLIFGLLQQVGGDSVGRGVINLIFCLLFIAIFAFMRRELQRHRR